MQKIANDQWSTRCGYSNNVIYKYKKFKISERRELMIYMRKKQKKRVRKKSKVALSSRRI